MRDRALTNTRIRIAQPDDDGEVPSPRSPVSLTPPGDLLPGERKFWSQAAAVITPADHQTLVDYCRACYWIEKTTKRLDSAWRRKNPDVRLVRMLNAQVHGWMNKRAALASALGLR